jgi:hypothetical protein
MAEKQFVLRGVNDELIRYYNVLTALPGPPSTLWLTLWGRHRRRRRGCLRRTRRRKTSRHAWIAVPHQGSVHTSAFPLRHRGSLLHPGSSLHGPAGQVIDTHTMAVIPARLPVLARFRCRCKASSHHSEVVSARPLPPPRRSIISSERGGQCSPASAAEAELHLITARQPVPAHFRR